MSKDSKKKNEAVQEIVDHFEKKLKENFIKNIMMGWETANKMILNYINDGHDIEDVKTFLENNLKPANKKKMEKIVNYGVVGLDESNKENKNKKKKG